MTLGTFILGYAAIHFTHKAWQAHRVRKVIKQIADDPVMMARMAETVAKFKD